MYDIAKGREASMNGKRHLYNNCKVLYVGFIGFMEGEATYKYGITRNIYQRFLQHNRSFPHFSPRLVYPSLHFDTVESMLHKELKVRNVHRTLQFHHKTYRELFVTSPTFTLYDTHSLILSLMEKVEKEYHA